MSKKKTNVDLILSLPSALTQAVLAAMTPAQKGELNSTQAGAIAKIATQAAADIADVLETDESTAGEP